MILPDVPRSCQDITQVILPDVPRSCQDITSVILPGYHFSDLARFAVILARSHLSDLARCAMILPGYHFSDLARYPRIFIFSDHARCTMIIYGYTHKIMYDHVIGSCNIMVPNSGVILQNILVGSDKTFLQELVGFFYLGCATRLLCELNDSFFSIAQIKSLKARHRMEKRIRKEQAKQSSKDKKRKKKELKEKERREALGLGNVLGLHEVELGSRTGRAQARFIDTSTAALF